MTRPCASWHLSLPAVTLTPLTRCSMRLKISARALVKQYNKTIRRFALRLAAKREFILDEAESVIKQAHEEVTRLEPELDAEWERKIAYARARQSVREYAEQRTAAKAATTAKVIRTYDCNNTKDVAALLKRFPGLADGGPDYSVRGE